MQFRTRAPYTFETATGAIDVEVPLRAVIRLREPRLNGVAVLRSPVKFVWEHVPGAEHYEATLTEKESGHGLVAEPTDPEWILDVPAGTWMLELEAIGSGRRIGALEGEPTFEVRGE